MAMFRLTLFVWDILRRSLVFIFIVLTRDGFESLD